MTSHQAEAAIVALQTALATTDQTTAQLRIQVATALDETRSLAIEGQTLRKDVMTALDETRTLAITLNPMMGRMEELKKGIGQDPDRP